MFDNLEVKAIQEIKDFVFAKKGVEISNETAQEILNESMKKLAFEQVNGTSNIKNPKGILGNL